MIEELAFRYAKESDVPAIARIESLSFKTPWSAEMILSEMREPLSRFTVATLSDEVIGYFGYLHILDELHILNVAVDPAHRGQGVGKGLMDRLLSEAKELGARALTLEVRQSNEPAIRLYESVGFAFVGIRPHYYTDKENALIYWLEL